MFKKPVFWLIVLVVFGFLLRLLTYGFIKIPWIIYDEYIYLDIVRNISKTGLFVTQMTRDQGYPAGWPLVISAFAGFIKDPYLQYKTALLITFLISSLTPVIAYFISKNIYVSFLLTIYSFLFVYSSSILSETFFIFMLLVLILVLKLILENDLNKPRDIVISGFVFGFLTFFMQFIRSFGGIIFPAFILAGFFYFLIDIALLKKQRKIDYWRLFFFSFFTLISYLLFSFLINRFLVQGGVYYQSDSYQKILKDIFYHLPALVKVVRNEIIIVFISQFWVLPFFFIIGFIKAIKEHKKTEIIIRLFLLFLLIGSLSLTVLHMLKSVYKNPQYLIFTRYLDPFLILLFVYSLNDFFVLLKTKLNQKLIIIYSASTIFLVSVFWSSFYFGSYKFGNSMPIFYLTKVKEMFYFWPTLFLFVFLFFGFLLKRMNRLAMIIFIVFFSFFNFVSIKETRGVPALVEKQYQRFINEWEKVDMETPICIIKNDVYGQTYYLYHFLNPGKHLKLCASFSKQNQPRRMLVSSWQKVILLESCRTVYRFTTRDTIYYCPIIK